MQYTTAILAFLASSGLVAALPGRSGWGPTCKKFAYSSTCSAVYKTKTQTKSYPFSTTITTTVYKPSTYITTVPTTIYITQPATSIVTVYSTETDTVATPYEHTSYARTPPPAALS
ncbi:hypothetical protein LTR08_004019 [Meristemomyces frigidus]|nr:hypothetical protein LTR08_004019 [Meristemomyces frigidus]